MCSFKLVDSRGTELARRLIPTGRVALIVLVENVELDGAIGDFVKEIGSTLLS